MTDAERIQKLTDALDWYADRVFRLKVYLLISDKNKVMEIVRELAVDCGNIADKAKR